MTTSITSGKGRAEPLLYGVDFNKKKEYILFLSVP